MLARLSRLPLFLLLLGTASVSMLVPAVLGRISGDYHDARVFFYAGLEGLLLAALTGIALSSRHFVPSALRQLPALAGAFLILPAFLSLPFYEALGNTTYLNAWFEMVSALTTTGASLFDPDRLSLPEQFWRVQVGWMGGLLIWVAASSILAPLALGGFEITAAGAPGRASVTGSAADSHGSPDQRLRRNLRILVPVYGGLTFALALALWSVGDPPLVAISHAMSVMSTSGISPIGGLTQAPSGFAGEVIIFCFLLFALSRLSFSSDMRARGGLWHDPEFRLGLILACAAALALFLRHWWAAFDVGAERELGSGLRAFWGCLFTASSFLTTTGFASADWGAAQGWSGLQAPGAVLMGLALMGGGVATTAGGVKLLRVYALYLDGRREVERLIHPHSIARQRGKGARIGPNGGFIAWISFMLFALTIAALTMVLGFLGVALEPAIVMTLAALSNTGPLITLSSTEPIALALMGAEVKITLGIAMVLGRLELLAVIVMFSPDVWRR